jgi:UDP-N-acetylmuramyl pentapeptide phosphotransferase/UDP-N-acetylglucosamine-1-phosphate transferase
VSFIQALQDIFSSPVIEAAALGGTTCFLLSVLIVLTKKLHGSATMDWSHGIQKFHTTPTPRVGGLPIVVGLSVAWVTSTPEIKYLLTPILIAGLPAFLFGLAEDITKRVGVLARLLATMASGWLAWWLTDYSLSRVDVWGIDWLLKYTLISVVFTSFAVGGVANAINIIDGFNGLASTMATLAFAGFAVIAWSVGDANLASVAIILAACVWGFFWVNWPFGKLFLGDGGSYFVGYALAWVAVLLIERNPSVSPFAALLVCIHPVSEVLLSIFRRKLKKMNPGHPDRLHFHSIVKQRYVRRFFGNLSFELRNSITGVLVGFMTLAAILIASLVNQNSFLSLLAVIALAMGYVAIYARMIRFKWCSPIMFLMTRPQTRQTSVQNDHY